MKNPPPARLEAWGEVLPSSLLCTKLTFLLHIQTEVDDAATSWADCTIKDLLPVLAFCVDIEGASFLRVYAH